MEYNDNTGQWEDPAKKITPPTIGAPNTNTGVNGPAPPPTSPTGAFDRNQYRDTWMSEGAKYGGDVNAFNSAHPGFSQGVTSLNGSKDKWILPTGEVMDLVVDQGGKNGAGWTGAGGFNGTSQYQYPGGDTSQSGSSGSSSSLSSSTSGLSGQDQAMRDQLFSQLMGRANQSLNIDRNDPIIRQQSDAYAAQTERSKRGYLADLAEKSGPNANLKGDTRLASEQAGQSNAGFEAQLTGRELASRRQEIQDALSSMQGLLGTDQQVALQKELAMIDDATRRLGITTNAGIANNQLGLGYAQLGSNNDQFLADYGLKATDQANYWDRARNPSAYPGGTGS